MSADEVHYPFIPKSNRFLRPGQFWAIQLSNGKFAAGRVTAVPAFGPRDRTGIVIGLIDWSGDHPPTASDIAGRPILVQAKSRFEAITNNGSQVLGLRPLDLDGLVPMDPMDFRVGTHQQVWGWRTIVNKAEKAFVDNA